MTGSAAGSSQGFAQTDEKRWASVRARLALIGYKADLLEGRRRAAAVRGQSLGDDAVLRHPGCGRRVRGSGWGTGMIDWDGPSRQKCPSCGRGPKDKTCGVTLEHDGSGVAHCFRCDYVETLRPEGRQQRPGTRQAPRTLAVRHEVLSEFGETLWGSCRPLAGEAVAYLEARTCVIPPADGDLRWHPALKHPPSGVVGPALVALVTDAITGQPLTLHRTWVCADGSKARLDPPRMLLGGHRKAGGVIRLWSDETVTTGLGIAEGIETALSLAHAYQPVWACIDAGNLAAFPLLPGVESLLVAADHDEAGKRAADQCARRWEEAGCDASIAMAAGTGADLNDLARAA